MSSIDNSSFNFSNNNSINSLTPDNVGGTSVSKGDTIVKQNLESSIKKLKEKVDSKLNLTWEKGNRRNCIRNRVANVFFEGRENVLNDIKTKLENVSEGFNVADLNLKAIDHSSVAKDVKNLEKRVWFVAQSQGTLGDKINFINECRNLVSDVYFVLEACLRAGNLKAKANDFDWYFVSHNGNINDKECLLDELLKYKNEFKSSNVAIREKYEYKDEEKDINGILEIFSTINTSLSQKGLPAFEIKGNKIKNFDKWFKNCVDQLNNLIGENNEKSSDLSNEQNVLEKEKVKGLWEQAKKGDMSGAGTFGEVYKATDDDKTYALKKIKINNDTLEGIKKEKSANEALAKNLKSFDKKKDVLYERSSVFLTGYMGQYDIQNGDKTEQIFVQEFCEGKNLQDVLLQNDKDFSGRLDSNGKLCLDVAVQMGHAVAELHAAGIVNRDIKPGNTMINIKGAHGEEEVSVKLIDLGTAYFLGDKQVKYRSNVRSFGLSEGEREVKGMGTLNYMAPEVLFKWENGFCGQPAVDVYAYGISVLEILLGGSLYENSTYKEGWHVSEVVEKNNYDGLLAATNKDPFYNFFKKLYKDDLQTAQKKTKAIKKKVPDENRQKFLAGILADCLAKEPTERISAAQAAELMQILASSLEKGEKADDLMSYEDAKAMVLKDRPKEVPPGIMDKLFSGNYQDYLDGMNAYNYLLNKSINTSTGSVGLVNLCFFENKDFNQWKENNGETCERMIENLLIDGRFDQLPKDKRELLETTGEYGKALCLAVVRAPYYDDENGTLDKNLKEKLKDYINKDDNFSDDNKKLLGNIRQELNKDDSTKISDKLRSFVKDLGNTISKTQPPKEEESSESEEDDEPIPIVFI